MESKEIKLNIQLTEKDYLTFFKTNQSGLGSKKWIIYIVILAALFLFFIVIDVLVNGIFNINLSNFAPLIIITVIWVYKYYSLKMAAKSAFHTDAFISKPYDVIVNDDGLQINSYQSTNFTVLWENIYRYKSNNEGIYIFIANIKAILLPIRFFNNETEIERLENLLKRNTSNSSFKKETRKKYVIMVSFYILMACIIGFIIYFPINKTDLYHDAQQYEENQDYLNAYKIYTQLIYQKPSESINYLYRAKCSQYIGNYIMAVQDCEQAISLGAKDGYAYYIYGRALYDNQQYDKACEAIKTSVKLGYTKDTEYFCEQ